MGTDSQGSTGTTQQTGTDGTAAPTSTGETTSAPTSTGTGTTTAGTAGGTTSTTDPLTGPGESTALSTTTLDPSTGDTSTGSSTTTTTTTTTDGSGTDTDGPDPECMALMQGMTDPPVPSGWVQCPNKLPHRVEAEVCLVPAPPSTCQLDDQLCKTNDDCKQAPFGSCQQYDIGIVGCGCSYGCETDADCDAGFVCRCGGDILGSTTRCVESKCSDDGDCGDEVCQFALSQGYDCPPEVVGGACTTPNDLCETDAPCFANTPCAFGEDKWECSLVACGRPFMVDDHAVTAPAAARDDWRALVPVDSAPASVRDALAAHWTQIALAEHASIASFARHILQLLAVGAPPEFVLATQQALADEVEHARLCFALAGNYAGTSVGPGPLAQAHVAGASDLESVVAAVIREACVGETLSALEAREAAVRADDPGLRRILAKIADDEQRHAELGWRFVRWARAQLDADARDRTDLVFTAAVADAAAAAQHMSRETGTPELRAHGVIDVPLRAAVWLRGLQGLVAPAAAALRAAA